MMRNETEFKIEDLVKVAKRENNTRRNYLYVNPLQGKHVPVSPGHSLALFSQLAQKAETRYEKETLLIVGFAETATAIGAAVACEAGNVKYYMHTTREVVPDADYLFFTESHSHATEQRLVTDSLDEILSEVDRIVFAEDEVTTGNTIEKLIGAIETAYPDYGLKFGILSILNSMSDIRIQELQKRGISCDFVRKIPTHYHVEELESHVYEPLSAKKAEGFTVNLKELEFGNYLNMRRVCTADQMRKSCMAFAEQILQKIDFSENPERILVLGTEEFMFPGMLLGNLLEQKLPDATVRFHATTRSPIEVSRDDVYPLHNRVPLGSVYEEGRATFLYNLATYDKVFIVTDAPQINRRGLRSLIGALEAYGNSDITLVRWRDEKQ